MIIIHSNAYGDYRALLDKALIAIQPSIQRLEREGHTIETHFTEYADTYTGVLEACEMTCCYKSDWVFFLPPDTLFSQDSLYNLVTYYWNEAVHVAVPHLRINREDDSINVPCDAANLRAQAWPILHYTATMSMKGIEPSVRHKGITVTERGMEHAIPTIYLCNFDAEDYAFLRANSTCKYLWDNEWLAHCYEAGKLRLVGSAKMACCFETTNRADNIPEPIPNAVMRRTAPHNMACRSLTYVY